MDRQTMRVVAAVVVFWSTFFAAVAVMTEAMGVSGVPREAQDAEFFVTFFVTAGFVAAAWVGFAFAFGSWVFGERD